jgi:integrase
MRLTDRKIRNTNPTDKDIFLGDGAGLYLRVRVSGSKIWQYRYKINKLTRWMELGIYPSLDLATARLLAHQAKASIKQGIDPAEKQKAEKLARAQEIERVISRVDVNELFQQWFKLDVSKRKDGGSEVSRAFRKDVLPVIGKIAAEDVTKGHISRINDAILERDSNRMARQTFALMRQMFRFALDRDYVQSDPTAAIRKAKVGKPELPRDRVLSDSEIQELFAKLPLSGLTPYAQTAISIALSTGCRIGELTKASWEHVDLETSKWTIPQENSKNGRSFKIKLSDFARNAFLTLRNQTHNKVWCFPNRQGSSHLDSKTISKQIGDRQTSSNVEKLKLENRSSQTNALNLSGGKWTPHDLRRTAATTMTKLGVLPDIADRCLNHLEQNRLRKVYQQYGYENEMAAAWDLLGNRLDVLQSNSNNVLIVNFAR